MQGAGPRWFPDAGPHTVAEMKRTNHEKDWPYVTALGVKLLEAGDPRGWLHFFNYDVLVQTATKLPGALAWLPDVRGSIIGLSE
jgi:hypothetical protein